MAAIAWSARKATICLASACPEWTRDKWRARQEYPPPDKPGVGMTLNEDVIKAYPWRVLAPEMIRDPKLG